MRILLTALVLSLWIFSANGQQTETPRSRPFVLGEVHELYSAVLQEQRTLNIYLPEGYKRADTVSYPVIYLLDGSADEDFIHIAGLVQYHSFDWINTLPKSIVVGIATVDRRRDYTFPTTIESDKQRYPTAGRSDRFIAFIESELQPFIGRNFKTSPSKTIIGQSLGGLLATEILFRRPSLFNTYIIVSPSLWWNNGSLLKVQPQIAGAGLAHPTNVYIGVGKEGATPTAIPRIMEKDAQSLATKIRTTNNKQVKVLFDYLPQENHATILHQAVSNAFRQLAAAKTTKH